MKKILLLLVVSMPVISKAQTIAGKANDLIGAYAAQKKFSGNVLIAKAGRVIFQKSYGYASIAGNKKNNSSTVFRAGSLTKMFTATLVIKSAAANKLSLTDPVSRYLPGFAGGDSICLQHLLSHTSGIRGSTAPGASTLREMLDTYQPDRPAFMPGTQFEYNNFNYLLLSVILEKVWNKPFPQLLQQEVLKNTGMVHSGVDQPGRIDKHAATGYLINPASNEWIPVSDDQIAAASGAGALYTTTTDLFRWSESIRNNGLLSREDLQQMTNIVQGDYGLGFIIRNFEGHRMYGHTGTIQGFNAAFMVFPQDSLTVVYLSNLQDMDAAVFERDLFALALGLPYKIPTEKKTVRLSEQQLQEYAGTYKMVDGTTISIVVENGKLIAIAPGGDKITLLAEAADRFFMQGIDSPVTFSRSENKVKGVTVTMGSEMNFKKM